MSSALFDQFSYRSANVGLPHAVDPIPPRETVLSRRRTANGSSRPGGTLTAIFDASRMAPTHTESTYAEKCVEHAGTLRFNPFPTPEHSCALSPSARSFRPPSCLAPLAPRTQPGRVRTGRGSFIGLPVGRKARGLVFDDFGPATCRPSKSSKKAFSNAKP